MHGNVWEWCRDWLGAYELPVRAGDGERLRTSSRDRVSRGGSFLYTARNARSAARCDDAPEIRVSDLGLRPARVRD